MPKLLDKFKKEKEKIKKPNFANLKEFGLIDYNEKLKVKELELVSFKALDETDATTLWEYKLVMIQEEYEKFPPDTLYIWACKSHSPYAEPEYYDGDPTLPHLGFVAMIEGIVKLFNYLYSWKYGKMKVTIEIPKLGIKEKYE